MDNREELISAYVDGELSAEEQEQVMQLLREDETAQQLYDEFQSLRSSLRSLPADPVDHAFSKEVLTRIEEVSSESTSSPTPSQPEENRYRTRMLLWPAMALAAAIMLMVFYEEPISNDERSLDATSQNPLLARLDDAPQEPVMMAKPQQPPPQPASEQPLPSVFSQVKPKSSVSSIRADSALGIGKSAARSQSNKESPTLDAEITEHQAINAYSGSDAESGLGESSGPPAASIATFTFLVKRGIESPTQLNQLLRDHLPPKKATADALGQLHKIEQATTATPTPYVFELTGTDREIRRSVRRLQESKIFQLVSDLPVDRAEIARHGIDDDHRPLQGRSEEHPPVSEDAKRKKFREGEKGQRDKLSAGELVLDNLQTERQSRVRLIFVVEEAPSSVPPPP